MNILLLAAEAVPYAKVGGLADVAGALPKALRRLGHDVRLVMPRYRKIDGARWGLEPALEPFDLTFGFETFRIFVAQTRSGGVPIYFVDVPSMFSQRAAIYGERDDGCRFLLFCAASLQLCEQLGWKPDVVHANDWHTAIVPSLVKHRQAGSFLDDAASIFTVHNLAYQGVVGRDALGGLAAILPPDLNGDWVNIMAIGLRTADVLTTVSPTYAREILTPEYGAGLEWLLGARRDRLFGILNGIDCDGCDPRQDREITANYSVDNLDGKVRCKRALQEAAGFTIDDRRPLLGMVCRLVDQKGFDLFAAAIEPILNETPLQITILGAGEQRYHELLECLEGQYRGRMRAWLSFDAIPAEAIYAGADMFLMPSRFEPCGLGQMIAMRYGTIPVVRATGGLIDTVREGPAGAPGTGFVFWPYEIGALQGALLRALDVYGRTEEWQALMRNAMQVDNCWDRSAQHYVDLYAKAVEWKRG